MKTNDELCQDLYASIHGRSCFEGGYIRPIDENVCSGCDIGGVSSGVLPVRGKFFYEGREFDTVLIFESAERGYYYLTDGAKNLIRGNVAWPGVTSTIDAITHYIDNVSGAGN